MHSAAEYSLEQLYWDYWQSQYSDYIKHEFQRQNRKRGNKYEYIHDGKAGRRDYAEGT